MLRLRAAGREFRTMVGSATRGAEACAMEDTRDARPGARVSFIAADRDHDAGRVDAIAGSEFLDDRIRLRE
jgi:hypothetical protein